MSLDLTGYLVDLVKIDTTNPPGNETPAALYVKRAMEEHGIPTNVYESAPSRGSAVARLKGNGTKKPLLLMSHLDVVNAKPEQWAHHPFSGKVVDGYIWGRGSLDCKHLVVMEMAVMLMLKQNGVELSRDIILAATADEESGGRHGVGYLVESHFPEVDAEFCINEGGGGALTMGGHTFVGLNTGDKGVTSIRLRASGTPGHASVPRDDTSITRLAEAILVLAKNRLPVHLTTTVSKYLEGVVSVLRPDLKWHEDLIYDTQVADQLVASISEDRQHANSLHAVLRNTATPTILQGGYRLNIIPEEAFCDVDGRILPGQVPDDFVEEVRSLVGHLVDVLPQSKGRGTESPVDTAMYAAIEDVVRSRMPGAKVVPTMLSGSTDAKYTRAKGIITYGFAPTPAGEDHSGVHGINERCNIEALKFGVDVLYDVVRRLCN